MSGLLSRLTGRRGNVDPIDYEKAKSLAGAESPGSRRSLAARDDAQPEILYFLAEDPDTRVRRAVAQNPSTPVQAGMILAGDTNAEVRCDLAQRIGRLAPQLDTEARARVGAAVNEVLEKLAHDQVVRVRQLLAEELKDAACVPPAVVERLARDDDPAVAAPVLEFSPLLDDAVLLDIIAGTPEGASLVAISRREGLSGRVADAVVATDDEAAIFSLLSNRSAQIREETLDALADRAESMPSWHEPLVNRPSLSSRAVRRLAEYVTETLVRDLESRYDIDADTAAILADTVRNRLEEEETGEDEEEIRETADERALRLFSEGTLDEDEIVAALDRGDRSFAVEALALMADLGSDVIGKAVSMASAKGMIAIAWQAGLTMRAAVPLQLQLARIPPGKVLKDDNGGAWPLSEDEMRWQLDFFAG